MATDRGQGASGDRRIPRPGREGHRRLVRRDRPLGRRPRARLPRGGRAVGHARGRVREPTPSRPVTTCPRAWWTSSPSTPPCAPNDPSARSRGRRSRPSGPPSSPRRRADLRASCSRDAGRSPARCAAAASRASPSSSPTRPGCVRLLAGAALAGAEPCQYQPDTDRREFAEHADALGHDVVITRRADLERSTSRSIRPEELVDRRPSAKSAAAAARRRSAPSPS